MADGKKKVVRRRGNTLARWEVAIVKAMIEQHPSPNNQDVLAYFSRPTRSINHRLIGEIRDGKKHKAVKPADAETLDEFLSTWADVDPETGLSIRGDELLIKAREAMIAAVHIFNSAGLTFRAELFIVTAVIAWTYLLHAWFRREGIEYKYPNQKTKEGEDKYWELGKCLKHEKCPAKGGAATNLTFLLDLRHEIEHRSTNRIDEAIGAKLQSCCINFNDLLKTEFGAQYGLEKRLPIALQFVSFGTDQKAILKKASTLPEHVEAFIETFEKTLSEEDLKDPAYRMTYGFIPVAAKKPGAADTAVQIVDPNSPEAEEIEKIIFKSVNKKRYPPGKVVEKVQAAGYPKFGMHQHTQLWKQLDTRKEGKGYGCVGDYGGWVWFGNWVELVLKHCEEQGDLYK